MQFSHIGIVADILWYEIKHHADRIELGEFVVMPNHIHGILILNDQNCDRNENDNDKRRDKACLVSTTNNKTIGQKRFQNQGKNTISSIVGGYKSAVTKHVRRLGYQFTWQSRFHDYIIRNDLEYDRIVKYIQNNPQNWHNDKFCDS
ncbi:transposase [Pleurocapsa sp. PCC 7319]|uniref:transposase n=1 Tax=Pleurocapsa sp. PCC 7319 TaxID=118161 RepID=UPI00192AACFE|nr:transposase [Pleurocapsa sp. PCC 7319]